MKKKLFLTLLSFSLFLTSCDLNFSNINSNTDTIDSVTSQNSYETLGKDSIFISNTNVTDANVTSDNITIENSLVENCRNTDIQLQEELKSGNYSWDNPMIIVNPYQNSPLTAVVLFQTKDEYGVKVTVLGKKKSYNITNQLTDITTSHFIPIIGLYSNCNNKVKLELIDSNGKSVKSQTILVKTDKLPDLMDDMVTVEKHSTPSAYNLTLITGQSCIYPFAYDEDGDIRWISTLKGGSNGVFPLSNGRFIYQCGDYLVPSHEKPHPCVFYEMDYLGRAFRQYFVEQGVHHDITEKTPGGNLMLISNSNDGYVEDVVMEIDRVTGQVVKSLDLKEVLGTYFRNMTDWAHTNTISYNPEDDTVLLSPRNTQSAIKVNWTTDRLIWIMGNPEVWVGSGLEDKVLKPLGDIQWHYQQHAVYQIDLNSGVNEMDYYIMFDNHWNTARDVECFDGLNNSYTLIYEVDEKNSTIAQKKIFTGAKSKITSNSTYDNSSNRIFAMSGNLKPAINNNWGMVYEYDYDSGNILNQYAIKEKFYRGYEMVYSFSDMCKPMDFYENYIGGILTSLKDVTENINEYTLPNVTLQDEVSFKMQDNILYMDAGDHNAMQVVFVGKNHCYLYDKSHITLKDESFRGISYYTPIPLNSLEADKYTIAIMYKGQYYNTEKTIIVK